MGRNVFWGETSYLCFLTKKVGRNVFWGETSQGEMSWGEMSSGEKRPAPTFLRSTLYLEIQLHVLIETLLCMQVATDLIKHTYTNQLL